MVGGTIYWEKVGTVIVEALYQWEHGSASIRERRKENQMDQKHNKEIRKAVKMHHESRIAT